MSKHPQTAPINWVSTLLFSLTFLVSVTLVPWYGIAVNPYDGVEWAMFVFFMFATGIGITGGYHRLWSHKAYEASPLLKWWYAFWGAGAVQNSILDWASMHRRHHRHVDDPDHDPYAITRGFWFAHMDWMVRDYPSCAADFSNVPDLERDPIVKFQYDHYLKFVAASTVVLPLLLGYLNGDVWGMFLLAGVFRLCVNHHFTFFINSLAHYWGKQPYDDSHSARDNGWIALLTYGEGYHNFHHSFQTDYRNGVRWWQIDPTKWFIAFCAGLGLVKELKRVPAVKMREALVTMELKQAEERLKQQAAEPQSALYTRFLHEQEKLAHNIAEAKRLSAQWLGEQRKASDHASQAAVDAIKQQLRTLEQVFQAQYKRLRAFNRELAPA